MRALPTLSADDGSGFHSNMPVSELIEGDTRAIEASVVSLAPSVAEIEDGVTHETQLTPIRPPGARGLEPPGPRLRDRGLKVGPRRVRGRLTSNKCQGRKTQMSLSGLCPTRLEADRVISSFLFDPNL